MQPQPVVTMPPQQPPQVLGAVQAPKIYEKYSVKQANVLGALQISFGILSIIMQIVAIVVGSDGAYVGAGIWCGVMFVVAGSLGIASAKQRTLGLIVATMVLSIIAAVLCVAQLVYGSIAYSNDNYYSKNGRYYYYYYGYRSSYGSSFTVDSVDGSADWGARKAMSIILLVLALAEAAVSIWQSALCCAACCCTTTPGRVAAPVIQYQMIGPGQPPMMVPGQPAVVYQQQPMPGMAQPFQPQGYPLQQPVAPVGGPRAMPPSAAGYAPPPQSSAQANPPPYAPVEGAAPDAATVELNFEIPLETDFSMNTELASHSDFQGLE